MRAEIDTRAPPVCAPQPALRSYVHHLHSESVRTHRAAFENIRHLAAAQFGIALDHTVEGAPRRLEPQHRDRSSGTAACDLRAEESTRSPFFANQFDDLIGFLAAEAAFGVCGV